MPRHNRYQDGHNQIHSRYASSHYISCYVNICFYREKTSFIKNFLLCCYVNICFYWGKKKPSLKIPFFAQFTSLQPLSTHKTILLISYLCARQRGREGGLVVTVFQFTPQIPFTTRAGPGRSQKSAVPPRSQMWIAGAQILRSSSDAFPGALAGSGNRNRAADAASDGFTCHTTMPALPMYENPIHQQLRFHDWDLSPRTLARKAKSFIFLASSSCWGTQIQMPMGISR